MATTSSRYLCLTLILAMIFVGMTLSNKNQAMAQTCGVNLQSLISNCQAYVKKSGPRIAPSKACCEVVRHLNLPCVCRYVNPQVENFISLDKAVYVGRSCGKAARGGSKCGSYTVPPS